MTDCAFSGNSASSGGGMYNDNSSSPTVTNCTFSGNSASNGGGMGNGNYSSPTVTDCAFSGNSASGGGGMHNSTYSSPTVTNCTFSGNSGGGQGGGMRNDYHCSPTVTNCTFSGNSANGGGGMVNRNLSNATLTNCTFIGNSANGGGGMLNFWWSTPTLDNCTFSGNSATVVEGGGMRNKHGASPTVSNCIFWGNSVPEIFNDDGGSVTVSYSDVQGGWTGTGNINADPMFADADGRLLPGSPCIDAGDNSAVTTDLDGNPRIVGLKVDMGAYEFQELSQHAAAKTEQLIDEVVALNLQQGINNSLDSKLDAVSKVLDDVNENNDIAAINALQAFINTVEAQRGNKIPEADADVLIADAQQIIDLLMAE